MTTKFIKVTEANNKELTLLLNTSLIAAIQCNKLNKDTHIKMSYLRIDKEGKVANDYYFVKESFEEIERMLRDGE